MNIMTPSNQRQKMLIFDFSTPNVNQSKQEKTNLINLEFNQKRHSLNNKLNAKLSSILMGKPSSKNS